jgi:hypothetical protein
MTFNLSAQNPIIDEEVQQMFDKYVAYWSVGDYDRIASEVYTAPMSIYYQDGSTLILKNSIEIKNYLIATFEELERNNYGYSKRNGWQYFRRENNLAYIEMNYTRFLKDSTIMKPIDRKSAYVLKKVNENFKITALIPFTAIAK